MKRYDLIYADPAWVYQDKSKSHGGGAESHYKCTPTEEMGKLQIPAKDDSICIMWVTYPQLEEGLKLMKMWGFEYKTVAFTWVKTNKNGTVYMGMGRYTRANAEIALLGKRGKGLKRQSASVYQTVLHERGKHSQKPHRFKKDLEELFGEVDRLEMFSREKSDGWDVWGNEVESDVELLPRADITSDT